MLFLSWIHRFLMTFPFHWRKYVLATSWTLQNLSCSFRGIEQARGQTDLTSKCNCLSRTSGRRNKLRLLNTWRINYRQVFKRGIKIWEAEGPASQFSGGSDLLLFPQGWERKERFWNVHFITLAHVWLSIEARIEAPHNSEINNYTLKFWQMIATRVTGKNSILCCADAQHLKANLFKIKKKKIAA